MSIIRFLVFILAFSLNLISYGKENEAIKQLIDSYDLKILMPEKEGLELRLKIESKTNSNIDVNKMSLCGDSLWLDLRVRYKDRNGAKKRTGRSSYHGSSNKSVALYIKLNNTGILPIYAPTLALFDSLASEIKKKQIEIDSIEEVVVEFGFTNLIKLPPPYTKAHAIFFPQELILSKQEIKNFLALDKNAILERLKVEQAKNIP